MTEFQLETLSILVDSGDMSAKHLAKQLCKKKGLEATNWKRYLLAAANTLYKLEEMGFCFCYSGSFRATLNGIEKVNQLLPLKPALVANGWYGATATPYSSHWARPRRSYWQPIRGQWKDWGLIMKNRFKTYNDGKDQRTATWICRKNVSRFWS